MNPDNGDEKRPEMVIIEKINPAHTGFVPMEIKYLNA